MTKNRTPTLVYLDPGMHPGLEVKGLRARNKITDFLMILAWASPFNIGETIQQVRCFRIVLIYFKNELLNDSCHSHRDISIEI